MLNQSAERRVRFITLGCKVNQYETQGMREILDEAGIVETRERSGDCEFVVINTCTVTEEADKENRYWIRRARREHPGAKIVVTGCYVERNRREIEAIPEVDIIVSNYEKDKVAVQLLGCGTPAVQDSSARRTYSPLAISRTQGAGRAFVKIQDGCNHSCSFCKVVIVRGRSRSRALPEIVEEAKRLRDAGYKELVFAGIQLGAYGLDLDSSYHLPEVLEACAKVEGIERLRLSSIEPTDIREPLIEALAGISKCCPHLHIPLQSGGDEILKKMNRRYERSFYRDLIARLKSELPGFCLTLDVMAGFPGEEENHFANTIELLESVRPLRCHVFPYSRREGTRAAGFEDCEDSVIRERVNRLMQLSDQLGRGVRMAYQGKVLPVLVEKSMQRGRLVQGLTANYLKVCFQAGPETVGEILPVELLTLQGDLFLGKRAEA